MKIEEMTEEIINKLYRYKEFPIVNGGDVDEKVNDYIEKVIKPENRVRLMATIDIYSLYGVLAEMESIPCMKKLKCSLICNGKVIYKGENYEKTMSFIR